MRSREAALVLHEDAVEQQRKRVAAAAAEARANGRPVDHSYRRPPPSPLPGGVLADDMGLGKTVTALALLVDTPGAQSLVLLPASLLMQWEAEILRHCRPQAVRVLVYHGPGRCERLAEALASGALDGSVRPAAGLAAAATAAAAAPSAPASLIVLATYETAARDVGDAPPKTGAQPATASEAGARGALALVNWTRVLCDEGHVLRNHKTATHRRLCQLQSRARWILTGTPLHNSANDLYGLVHFLRWHPFTKRDVWRATFGAVAGEQQEARLQLLAAALMLRRTKQDKNEQGALLVPLPQRHCHSVAVRLSQKEREEYNAALEHTKQACAKLKQAARGQRAQVSAAFLVALLRLRLMCNHRSLCSGKVESANTTTAEQCSEDGEAAAAAEPTSEPPTSTALATADADADDIEALAGALDSMQLKAERTRSSKLDAVIAIVKQVLRTASDKVLLVSQWTGTLNLVRTRLLGFPSISQDGPAKRLRCISPRHLLPVPLWTLTHLPAHSTNPDCRGAPRIVSALCSDRGQLVARTAPRRRAAAGG